MAKLSLWLITMDRERPFGFLDDRLVCGDSLLGLASMDQLEYLHLDPAAGRRLQRRNPGLRRRPGGPGCSRPPTCAAGSPPRRSSRSATSSTRPGCWPRPANSSGTLTVVGRRSHRRRPRRRETARARRATPSSPGSRSRSPTRWTADSGRPRALGRRNPPGGPPDGTVDRQPLHWPLAFPEVFADAAQPGFDAIIGNPPFLGGQKISGTLGDDYLAWLQRWDGSDVKGSADLAARFVLRADGCCRPADSSATSPSTRSSRARPCGRP